MKTRIIYVEAGSECPADVLLADFRKVMTEATDYAKNIEFSESSVQFFRERADIVEETEDNIRLFWDVMPELDLPPLEVKIRKKNGKYSLSYLNEYGDEKTSIKGKTGKGKNKGVSENIIIVKRDPKAQETEQGGPSL